MSEDVKAILFLDDSHERAAVQYLRWPEDKRNRTIWCETAQGAIDILKEQKSNLDEVHLDHDLGLTSYQNSGAENCGMEVVRYMENLTLEELSQFKNTCFIIHSWNLPANEKMTKRLGEIGLKVVSRPFGTSGY